MAHAFQRNTIIPARPLLVSGSEDHDNDAHPSFRALVLPTVLPPRANANESSSNILQACVVPRRDPEPLRSLTASVMAQRMIPIVQRLKPVMRIAQAITQAEKRHFTKVSPTPHIVARTRESVIVQVAIPVPRGSTKTGTERRIKVAAVAESLKPTTETDKRAKQLDKIREDTFISDSETDVRYGLAVTSILKNHNALVRVRLGVFGGFTIATRGNPDGVRLMGVHEYMDSLFTDTNDVWERRDDESLRCVDEWKIGSTLERALDHGNEVERQLSQIFKHTRDRADGTDSCAVRIAAKLAEVDLRPVIAQLRVGSLELGVATAADLVCAAPDGSLCVIELKCGYAKHVSSGYFRVFRNGRWLQVRATLANRFCLQAGLTRELMLNTFRMPRFRTSFMSIHITGQKLHIYQPDIELQHFAEMAARPL